MLQICLEMRWWWLSILVSLYIPEVENIKVKNLTIPTPLDVQSNDFSITNFREDIEKYIITNVSIPNFVKSDDPYLICPPIGPTPPESLMVEYKDCINHMQESLHQVHPDQHRTVPQLLRKYGYPFEEYEIKTKDLYTLTVHRIIGSPKRKGNTTLLQPIYFNHGLAGSSEWWFFHPPHRSLPIILADAGYDVWLSNCRGSTYSLEHDKCHWNVDLCYWDYTFHEMAIYDVPAVTKKILSKSKYDKTFYIGYSMGTTQFLISQAEVPKMKDKILAAFLLAPIAYMGHSTNPIRTIVQFLNSDKKYQALNVALRGRMHSSRHIAKFMKITIGDICTSTAAKCGLCDNLWFAIMGYNAHQMNRTQLPLIFSKMPNSQSVKVFSHYTQLISSCRFQKFDYGWEENLVKYKNPQPPEYDLSQINVPLYMYYADLDNFGVPLDVDITVSKLRKGIVKEFHKIEDPMFNHADFVFAKDADKLVYNRILKAMQTYNP